MSNVATLTPTPRICINPAGPSAPTDGPEIAELATAAGLGADLWQRNALDVGLACNAVGYAAGTVGVLAGRMQGKTELGLGLALGQAFMIDGHRVVFGSSSRALARNAFHRLETALRSHVQLSTHVEKISRANGAERIRLINGSEILFVTTAGRSAPRVVPDLVILDDAAHLPLEFAIGAAQVISPRPTSQIWYLGTAVDKDDHPHGQAFASVRHAALTQTDPAIAWIEHSVDDARDADGRLLADTRDPEVIAQANPAGDRVGQHLDRIREQLRDEWFERENLSIGRWPDVTAQAPVRG